MYMTAKVSTIPKKYPIMQVLKYGVLSSLASLIFNFYRALSTSNLMQRATKIPGTTMSPNPSMLNFCSVTSIPSQPTVVARQGKTSLMGMSRFLATVTMTSVPQTQKMSQKKRAHRRMNPTLNELILMDFSAVIEKRIPKTLLRNQCLVK